MRGWVQWINGSLAAGATMFLVGAAFHLLVPVIAPDIASQFAANPSLYRPWDGWTSTYMLFHPFLYGSAFAAGFLGLKQWTGFPLGAGGGLTYGAGVFLVGSLPVFVLMFASMQISSGVILSWLTQNLTQYSLAGVVLGCVCDGASLRVSTILPRSAKDIWELLLLKESFLYVTRGLMSYSDTERWPEKLFAEVTTLSTQVRLFGLGPSFPHHVQITKIDEANGVIETKENGGLVRIWNHQMRVEPISESECRYTDRIELHAGLITPLVWLFASVFYRYRQWRWQEWARIAAERAEPLLPTQPTSGLSSNAESSPPHR